MELDCNTCYFGSNCPVQWHKGNAACLTIHRDAYVVAIPENEYSYTWIAIFDSREAADSYAIKFEDAIVVALEED